MVGKVRWNSSQEVLFIQEQQGLNFRSGLAEFTGFYRMSGQ
jgi:hypothetical protein